MFRDLLSNRVIIGALIFVVLVVAGTQLYSLHVRRTGEAKVARTAREVQHLTNDKETHPQQDVDVPTGTEALEETPLETNDTQMLSEETEAVTDETFESLELADAFLPGDLTLENEEEFAEDVPVSPHGFGPYPEIPVDFPAAEHFSWDPPYEDPVQELMMRTRVKLWKQGVAAVGIGAESNGLFYPIVRGTVYAVWDSDPDNETITVILGHPDDMNRIENLQEDPFEPLNLDDIPLDIKVLDFDAEGIDPYQFLNL